MLKVLDIGFRHCILKLDFANPLGFKTLYIYIFALIHINNVYTIKPTINNQNSSTTMYCIWPKYFPCCCPIHFQCNATDSPEQQHYEYFTCNWMWKLHKHTRFFSTWIVDQWMHPFRLAFAKFAIWNVHFRWSVCDCLAIAVLFLRVLGLLKGRWMLCMVHNMQCRHLSSLCWWFDRCCCTPFMDWINRS